MGDNTVNDFEQSLQTLDEITQKMQSGNLPLEASLSYFEQGINLIKNCQKTLTEAEQRVQILTQDQQLKDFPHEDTA